MTACDYLNDLMYSLTTALENASAPCWMGKQDLRDCDYMPLNASATCWMGKQDLRIVNLCRKNTSATCWMGERDCSDCDYVSKECEPYLLNGGAGFEGL